MCVLFLLVIWRTIQTSSSKSEHYDDGKPVAQIACISGNGGYDSRCPRSHWIYSRKMCMETPFGLTPLETWTPRAFVCANWLRSFLANTLLSIKIFTKSL